MSEPPTGRPTAKRTDHAGSQSVSPSVRKASKQKKVEQPLSRSVAARGKLRNICKSDSLTQRFSPFSSLLAPTGQSVFAIQPLMQASRSLFCSAVYCTSVLEREREREILEDRKIVRARESEIVEEIERARQRSLRRV